MLKIDQLCSAENLNFSDTFQMAVIYRENEKLEERSLSKDQD